MRKEKVEGAQMNWRRHEMEQEIWNCLTVDWRPRDGNVGGHLNDRFRLKSRNGMTWKWLSPLPTDKIWDSINSKWAYREHRRSRASELPTPFFREGQFKDQGLVEESMARDNSPRQKTVSLSCRRKVSSLLFDTKLSFLIGSPC